MVVVNSETLYLDKGGGHKGDWVKKVEYWNYPKGFM
jgi:hypothetical protein